MRFITGKSFGEIGTYSFPDILCLAYINQFIPVIKIFINAWIGG
jgi:hypothetical protein